METVASSEVSTPTKGFTTWPGAFGIFKYSRAAMQLCLGTVLLLFVTNILISIISNGLFKSAHITGTFISYLVSSFIGTAFIYTVLSAIRGKRVELKDALTVGWGLIIKAFLLNLLVSVTVIASFIFFIIPGFFVLPRLILAPYFLVDQKLDVMAAFRASWEKTKGHSAKVWGIIGASILMALPVITIIGIIAAVYLLFMYAAAMGLLYNYIKDNPTAKA